MLGFHTYLEASEIAISLVWMMEREHWLHIAQQRCSVDFHYIRSLEWFGNEEWADFSDLLNQPSTLKKNILVNLCRHAASHQARGIVWNKQASGQQKALSADQTLRAELVIRKRAQQLRKNDIAVVFRLIKPHIRFHDVHSLAPVELFVHRFQRLNGVRVFLDRIHDDFAPRSLGSVQRTHDQRSSSRSHERNHDSSCE